MYADLGASPDIRSSRSAIGGILKIVQARDSSALSNTISGDLVAFLQRMLA